MKNMMLAVTTLAAFASFNAHSAAPVSSVGATGASAASDTIHFEGEIVATTCVVNSSTPKNQTVTLPTVSNQLFGGDTTTTGDKAFQLQFSKCTTTTGVNGYAVHFDGNTLAGKDTSLETQRNGNTPATDVAIEVFHGGNPIHFTNGAGANDIALTPNSSGDATLDLVAKYEQIGSTIPAAGTITADMRYTVVYK